MSDKPRVVVLMGGESREREISLRSGKKVLSALLLMGYPAFGLDPQDEFQKLLSLSKETVDKVFIALHGQFGEDGVIQGLLECLKLPYTGSKVTASAIAMHKVQTKRIFQSVGISTPDFLEVFPFLSFEKQARQMVERLRLPVVVKPVSEGSSFGIQIVREAAELPKVLEETVKEFQSVFVERYVQGQEVTVGIVGLPGKEQVLPVLELIPHREFYDFKAKYTKGLTDFVLPARLSEEETKQVQEIALAAHRAIGCFGLSRVDLIVESGEGATVHEVNTIPGMTDLSDLPAQAAHMGISYPALVEMILMSAV